MPRTTALRALVLAVLALAAALGVSEAAVADGLQFSAPLLLPHGDPNGDPFLSGGEPSLAFDPLDGRHVYVTAPQGIPSAVGGVLGGNSTGVAYWASDDGGASWPKSGLTGVGTGGGDSDVEVLAGAGGFDHRVLVADLEAAAAAICTSQDYAKSFQDCDGGMGTNQQGPENDRQWLTRGTKPGEVYLTYHDFAGGLPIIERSTDGGKSFTPCGTIIDPAGPAAQTYTPAGGTLVSKPVVGSDGTVYVEFTTPDQDAPPVGAKLNHLYMAVAKGGCSGQTVFENHVIYTDPGADLAKIFQAQAIDGGGQLYVLTGGQTKAGQTLTNLWLFTSGDGGRTWSAPVAVNPPELKANVFPTIAGGPNRGQVAFGWFGTATSGDPNTQTNQWRFYAGASLDGGRTFAYQTVTPDPIHYGDICTQGIFCGLIPGQPGNRNLADFASVAVSPADGCAALAIPGDPYNRPDQPNGADNFSSSAYFSRQTSSKACFTAKNAGKPASTIAGSRSVAPGFAGCGDRSAPVSRVASARVSRTRRLTVRGSARDRGCGTGGTGKVRRVDVAVARRASGHRCRFLRPSGQLSGARSCSSPTWLRASGTSAWRLRPAAHLRGGRYLVRSRAVDAAGNREPGVRRGGARAVTVG